MAKFQAGDFIRATVETSQLRLNKVYEVKATSDGLLFVDVVALGIPTHRGEDPIQRYPLNEISERYFELSENNE